MIARLKPIRVHPRGALAAVALVAALVFAATALVEVALLGVGAVFAVLVGALAMTLPPPVDRPEDES